MVKLFVTSGLSVSLTFQDKTVTCPLQYSYWDQSTKVNKPDPAGKVTAIYIIT